jgi:VIT1/CCC1 family predicted Fe2+/Mn2+ transporter
MLASWFESYGKTARLLRLAYPGHALAGVTPDMDAHLHRESHFQASDLVRDIVIGMADGLTVPFALAAGISGVAASAGTVITAGVAEIAAGAVAMALGGYLAVRGECDHYAAELAREEFEIVEKPDAEAQEVAEIFEQYGLAPSHYGPVIEGLRQRPAAWRDFMMRFELGLERPDPARAQRSALTIGASYVVGGAIPLAPYVLLHSIAQALPWSAAVTLAALAAFGFVKGHFTGAPALRSAVQTLAIGGAAAAVAFLLARAVS